MKFAYGLVVIFGLTVLGFYALHDDLHDHIDYVLLTLIYAGTLVSFFAFSIEVCRPSPPVRSPGDCIRAVYSPHSEPIHGAEEYLGTVHWWRAVRKVRHGHLGGVWVLRPCGHETCDWEVPLTDLLVQDSPRR